MNNSYITIIKEKRTVLSRKRVPLNQNECTANFRIGVPFEQNLHSGGIFGLCDPVDRKCIIVFAGRDFMSLDVEADAELEAQLPAWIRRESADRDAADADGKRPVSAG